MSNEAEETPNDTNPPMDTVSKVFIYTKSSFESYYLYISSIYLYIHFRMLFLLRGATWTTSTADSPNAKRLCVTNGTDPTYVNKSRSVIKSKTLKDKCA